MAWEFLKYKGASLSFVKKSQKYNIRIPENDMSDTHGNGALPRLMLEAAVPASNSRARGSVDCRTLDVLQHWWGSCLVSRPVSQTASERFCLNTHDMATRDQDVLCFAMGYRTPRDTPSRWVCYLGVCISAHICVEGTFAGRVFLWVYVHMYICACLCALCGCTLTFP